MSKFKSVPMSTCPAAATRANPSPSQAYIYSQAIFGDVSHMHALVRITVWICFVIASYALALLVASVVDLLALTKLQRILKKKFLKPAIRES